MVQTVRLLPWPRLLRQCGYKMHGKGLKIVSRLRSLWRKNNITKKAEYLLQFIFKELGEDSKLES